MSQIEKLKKKFFSKPIRNDMTLNEVKRLAEYYGCKISTGGNHQIRIAHIETGTVIPLPCHDKCVKEAHIKELKDLFMKIEG